MTTVQVGVGGELQIPPDVLRMVGIEKESFVVVERVGAGILVRPAAAETEEYTLERKAEFLLSTAVDDADYAAAANVVRGMGLDPDRITHRRRVGV